MSPIPYVPSAHELEVDALKKRLEHIEYQLGGMCCPFTRLWDELIAERRRLFARLRELGVDPDTVTTL